MWLLCKDVQIAGFACNRARTLCDSVLGKSLQALLAVTTTRQAAAEADAAAAAAATAAAAAASAAAAAAARKVAAAAAAAASAAADAAPKAGDATRPLRRSLAPRESSGFGSQQHRSMLPAAGTGRDALERGQAQDAVLNVQSRGPAGDPEEALLPAQLPAQGAASPSDACRVACLGAPEHHTVGSAQAAADLTHGLAPAQVHFELGASAPMRTQDHRDAPSVRLRLSLPDMHAMHAAQEVGDGTVQHTHDGDSTLMLAAAAHLRQSLFGTLPAQQALGGAGSHPVRPEALPGVSAAAREAGKAGVLGPRAPGTGAFAGSAAPTAHEPTGQNPGVGSLDPSQGLPPDLHVADDVMAAALGRRAAGSRVGLGLGHARRSLVQLAAAVVDAPGLTPGRGITPPSGDAAPPPPLLMQGPGPATPACPGFFLSVGSHMGGATACRAAAQAMPEDGAASLGAACLRLPGHGQARTACRPVSCP